MNRFTDREGLILHQVSYQDGDKHRPLFYRMSVGELFVGYGDPRPPYYQKFVSIFQHPAFSSLFNRIDDYSLVSN